MTDTLPSWMRRPGNCCETCVSWSKDKYLACCNPVSMDSGETTDSRYRCPNFERRQDGR
jgi:hypothetical protein